MTARLSVPNRLATHRQALRKERTQGRAEIPPDREVAIVAVVLESGVDVSVVDAVAAIPGVESHEVAVTIDAVPTELVEPAETLGVGIQVGFSRQGGGGGPGPG